MLREMGKIGRWQEVKLARGEKWKGKREREKQSARALISIIAQLSFQPEF